MFNFIYDEHNHTSTMPIYWQAVSGLCLIETERIKWKVLITFQWHIQNMIVLAVREFSVFGLSV